MEAKIVKEYELLYLQMVRGIAAKHQVSPNDIIFGAHKYYREFRNTVWVREYYTNLVPFNQTMSERLGLPPGRF